MDSRKNAARPSIASGAPNTSPTNREYADQFMPNSNSCTRPVTTPIATLISSSVPKNRSAGMFLVARPVPRVCRMATRKANPMVIGTNKKW